METAAERVLAVIATALVILALSVVAFGYAAETVVTFTITESPTDPTATETETTSGC